MGKYLFKVGWFAPDGKRYRKSRNKDDFREVPDSLVELLPSTVKPYDPKAVEAPVTSEKLSDHDHLRAAAEAVPDPYRDADERSFAESMAERAAKQARDARRKK